MMIWKRNALAMLAIVSLASCLAMGETATPAAPAPAAPAADNTKPAAPATPSAPAVESAPAAPAPVTPAPAPVVKLKPTAPAAAAGPHSKDAAAQPEMQPVSEAQKKLLTIVSVDFKETPIDDAITFLSDSAGVDIIKSPQVTGTVTAKISDAPLSEVLENILALNGAGYVATDRVIRVVPRAEMQMQKEVRLSKVYRITYADTKQVGEAIKNFASKDAEVAVYPGSSNIIVTDTEAKIKDIDVFVEEVDRQTAQVLIEVRIYDISSQNGIDLGVNWSIGTNTTYDATTGAATGGKLNPFANGLNNSSENISSGSSSFRFGWLNDSVDIDVLIRAQQEDLSATLLANPRLLVLDNEKANFKAIEEIPYQELQQTSAGGNIGTTSFKEVGVLLDVTPHVTRDNMLRCRIVPEFSTVSRTVNVAAAGTAVAYPQPVIDQRKTDTTLLTKDGQTIVMSGMRKKETTKRINKVPLLGDLPLVGAIFRNTSESVVNRELVVFLTPKIVISPSLNAREKDVLKNLDTQLTPPPAIEKPVVEGGAFVGKPTPDGK
jgi:type IV pilus assembly protein PilQ